jgi:thioredoxin-dependent peroxiredoxin
MNEALLPDFSVEGTGGPFQSADCHGRLTVLYFYPKDNTSGCTTEGMDFAALYAEFVRAGCAVFGVSRDSLKSHAGFKATLSLPFDLLSDPDEVACTALGVMKLKMMYGKQVRGIERSTFVIGRDGQIVQVWRGVKAVGHAAEVLSFVKSLSST